MNPIEAIHRAFREDNAALFRVTLSSHPELKARINDPVGPFDSPLITSVRSRAMLDALLEAGADINARSRWWAGGFGLLDHANDDVAFYALTRGARLDVHSAARLGLLSELRAMIAAEPGLVRARGGDGKTPLHCARNLEVARFLVEHGAEVNARDIDHESTPAQYLIGEHANVVRYLLTQGAEADIFIAAALGELDLIRRLIEKDPNCLRSRVNSEYFPMKNPRAGGTIYQWTLGFNISPHEVAKNLGQDEAYRLLMERSPVEIRLLAGCWAGDEQTVRAILRDHPDILGRLTRSDLRQMADAARNNAATAVRLMLEAGFPVDIGGQHQGTPLHWAAWHGNTQLVDLLLARHAPLERADNDFHGTPLAWAVHGSENGWERAKGDYPSVVRALLRAGATVPNRADGTPEVRRVLAEHRQD